MEGDDKNNQRGRAGTLTPELQAAEGHVAVQKSGWCCAVGLFLWKDAVEGCGRYPSLPQATTCARQTPVTHMCPPVPLNTFNVPQ